MAELVRVLGINGAGGVAPSVSRLLRTGTSAGRASFDMLLFQLGEPLLDSEMNLYSEVIGEQLDLFISQLTLTGYTLIGSVAYSALNNALYFGESWACAKGRFVHVSNPDQPATLNGESLPPLGTVLNLSAAPGGTRTDMVWLEFWYHEVAPFNTVTPNDTDATRTIIYKEGGVANQSLTANSSFALMDPQLAQETTRRVQLRWRWREATTVNWATYPAGFATAAALGATSNPVVLAQGGASSTTGLTYSPVIQPNGVVNLWRAGDGSASAATTLNSVDGYAYGVMGLKLTRTPGNVTISDLRPPSRIYIPPRSIHTLQMALGSDVTGAGIEGTLGASGTNIKPGTISGTDIGADTINDANLNGGTITRRVIQNETITNAQLDPNAWPCVVLAKNQVGDGSYAPNGSVVKLVLSGGALVFGKPQFNNDQGLIGVVENYPSDRIAFGVAGYVRIAGHAANVTIAPDTSPGIMTPLVTKANDYFAWTASSAGNPTGSFAVSLNGIGAGQYQCWLRGPLYLNNEIPATAIQFHTITDAYVAFGNIDPYDNGTGTSTTPAMRRLDASGTNPGAACGATDVRLNPLTPRPPTGSAGGHLTGSYPNPNIGNAVITAAQLQNNCVTDAKLGTALVYMMTTAGFTTTNNVVQSVPWSTAGHANPPDLISTYAMLGSPQPWQSAFPANFVIQATRGGLYQIEVNLYWGAVNELWYGALDLYRTNDGYQLALDARQFPNSFAVSNNSTWGGTYSTSHVAYTAPLAENDTFQVRTYTRTLSGAGVTVDRVRIVLTRLGNYA